MKPRIKKSENGWFCYEGDIRCGAVWGREGSTPYQAYMRQQADQIKIMNEFKKQQAALMQ